MDSPKAVAEHVEFQRIHITGKPDTHSEEASLVGTKILRLMELRDKYLVPMPVENWGGLDPDIYSEFMTEKLQKSYQPTTPHPKPPLPPTSMPASSATESTAVKELKFNTSATPIRASASTSSMLQNPSVVAPPALLTTPAAAATAAATAAAAAPSLSRQESSGARQRLRKLNP